MAQLRNRFARWPFQFGVALLLVGALARPAAAGTTYHVSTVSELQSAITAVNAGTGGDLIVLAPGVYALTSSLGYIFQDVTIQGDPLAPTVIIGDSSFTIFSLRANNVSIENLTLRDAFTAISYEGANTFSGTGLTLTGNFYGIYFGDSRGTSNLTNSTIANNTFGVKVDCAGFNLTNVTVTGNEAGIDFASCGEQMRITNSLIVANGEDCTRWGAITPVGDASFDSDGTCVARGWPGMISMGLASLGLGSLASNGGPTQTAEISATSAAVDAGSNAACPTVDQRGFTRGDGACDIGAFEYGAGTQGGNTQPGSGSPVTVSPVPGVTVTFSDVTSAGDTTATTGGPAPPNGFQVDGLVYDISTTAGVVPPITVCLPYNPATNPFPIFSHFESAPPPPGWVNRTSSVDPVNQVVCGVVSSLSPFAVLMPSDVTGQLQQLQALIARFNLRKPVARRFIHQLDEVREAWAHSQAHSRHHKHSKREFCEELNEFTRAVRRQSGRTLTAAEAGQILVYAQLIASEVGCGS